MSVTRLLIACFLKQHGQVDECDKHKLGNSAKDTLFKASCSQLFHDDMVKLLATTSKNKGNHANMARTTFVANILTPQPQEKLSIDCDSNSQ